MQSCVNVRCRSQPTAGAVQSSEKRRPSHQDLGALLLVSHLELSGPAFALSNLNTRPLSKHLRRYPFDIHLALYRLPYLVFFRVPPTLEKSDVDQLVERSFQAINEVGFIGIRSATQLLEELASHRERIFVGLIERQKMLGERLAPVDLLADRPKSDCRVFVNKQLGKLFVQLDEPSR